MLSAQTLERMAEEALAEEDEYAALSCLEQLTREQPTYKEGLAFYRLGKLYYSQNKIELALSTLQKAYQQGLNQEGFLQDYAETLLAQQQFEVAFPLYAKILFKEKQHLREGTEPLKKLRFIADKLGWSSKLLAVNLKKTLDKVL